MNTRYSCSRCGTNFPDNNDQPCPNCGGTRRSIFVSIEETVGIRDNHSVGIMAGNTGRYALHSDTQNPTDVSIIQKHVEDFVAGNTMPAKKYLDGLVAAFSCVLSNTNGVYYRGLNSSTKINGSRIGPSPKSGDGRYNESGEKCIYLIDNVAFLPSEINASQMHVQEYNIPITGLRIADLSSNNQNVDNSLALVFQFTERGRTNSGFDFETAFQARGQSKYLLGQYVARVFKNHGWDGLYVPGVHGKPGDTYTNLVLFGSCVDVNAG